MATNPKLPDFQNPPPRRDADQHGKVQMIRQSKFPWPLLALIVGAAMLIAIIAVLPKAPKLSRTPSAAEAPRQPTVEQIQLTSVRVVPAPVGNPLYLDAILHNTGNSEITGVQVVGQFLGKTGQAVGTQTSVVQGAEGGGTTTQDLTQAPIKPNDQRPVRILFDRVPAGWNHEVPNLTVTTVTGTTP